MPAVGNVIPSRWAYEALAVTNYVGNDYERDFFDLDKVKYETEYYRHGFIYQLQSANETMNTDRSQGRTTDPRHLALLKTELPHLATVCDMKPYSGTYDYQSLRDYLDKAEQKMITVGNIATLEADRMKQDMVERIGKDGMLKLKRASFNLQLETQLAGHDAKQLCEVVEGHIVPRAGFVYLTPRSMTGNAPFYSSEKRLGSLTIPTLWFNMSVMMLMCIVAVIMLLADFPGRYIRR